jgi:hypothetical protein
MSAAPKLAIAVESVMLVRVTGEPWLIFVGKRRVNRRFPEYLDAIKALAEDATGRVPFEFEPDGDIQERNENDATDSPCV